MPNQDPRIQSAIAELERRGVKLNVNVPDPAPAPMIDPSAVTPAAPAAPAPAAPPQPADLQATGAQPAPDYSSPRGVERQLRLKQMKGQLAIQDAVNELQRRGVNLKLKTAGAAEEVVTTQAQEAVENARRQGDPESFKGAWRALFPGKPLPRTPDGQIDYQGGQDDIDVELDRKKKLEATKAGVHNITETKVTRQDPATGKDREYLVRTDKVTGQIIGETLLSENQKPLTESQSNAKMFATRLQTNNGTLLAIEAKGFQPSALGTTVQKFLPNRFRSDDFQAYNAAKQNWIAAVLRKESGAAISSKEYSDADAQYFPQDGDSAQVVKQKQSLREQVQRDMQSAVGPHQPSAATAPAPAPAAGVPTSPTAPAATSGVVDVQSAAEAPPTAQFIRSPSGRVYRNPRYTGQ
jgi:hypothetical protein